jgi:nucleotide-binding universal stress UspA family protein
MNVLLAADGSPASVAAEEFLSKLPLPEPPDVTVVSVCPVPDLHMLASDVTEAVEVAVEECRRETASSLAAVARRCRVWAKNVETRMPDGHPAEELLKEIDRDPPAFAVLGARGIGAVARFLLGSISDQVARHARCPVLIVRPKEAAGVRTIIIADDGSPQAAAAVNRVAGWRLGPERTVHLIQCLARVQAHGITDVWHSHEMTDVFRGRAQERLEDMRKRLTPTRATVELHVEFTENAADQIQQLAEEQHADLIVLGSTGKSAWQRLLLGSVAQRVLHHAPCSVWIERETRQAPTRYSP